MCLFDSYPKHLSKSVWQSGLLLRSKAENCFKGMKFSQILKQRGTGQSRRCISLLFVLLIHQTRVPIPVSCLRHWLCFVFILFLSWGVLFSTKITNNNRSTKEGKKERASSLRIRNQAHESHLAYPSNEIRQFELRQTVSQLKKTMTGHGRISTTAPWLCHGDACQPQGKP